MDLDPEQKVIVEAKGNVLVEAPLGTGKTETLLAKAASVSCPVVLTFTRYARMKAGPTAMTLHSFCWQLLGRPPVVDRAEQYTLMVKAFKECGYDLRGAAGAVRCLDLAKLKGLPVSEAHYVTYEKLKGNSYDYTDLLLDGLEVLREEKPTYHENVLVDEFQDLNSLQYEILKAMNPKNVTVFGDPYQSIYEWRDAYPTIFDKFRADFDPVGLPLRTNHRSCEEVVNLLEFIYPRGIKGSGHGKVLMVLCKNADYQVGIVRSVVKDSEKVVVLSRLWRPLEDLINVPGAYFMCDRENESRFFEDGKGRIALSSVHTYKGLGCETVILVSCSNGTIPMLIGGEEEKRIFYTACGRAERNLVIVCPGQPSTFLMDAPVEVIDTWE